MYPPEKLAAGVVLLHEEGLEELPIRIAGDDPAVHGCAVNWLFCLAGSGPGRLRRLHLGQAPWLCLAGILSCRPGTFHTPRPHAPEALSWAAMLPWRSRTVAAPCDCHFASRTMGPCNSSAPWPSCRCRVAICRRFLSNSPSFADVDLPPSASLSSRLP
jgi:hypothetical protein